MTLKAHVTLLELLATITNAIDDTGSFLKTKKRKRCIISLIKVVSVTLSKWRPNLKRVIANNAVALAWPKRVTINFFWLFMK